MSRAYREELLAEFMSAMDEAGFEKLGSRDEILCYFHLYSMAKGPYFMLSCVDSRTENPRLEIGRVFSNPKKRFPGFEDLMLPVSYKDYLQVLGIDTGALPSKENLISPGELGSFLRSTLPSALERYSPELMDELEVKTMKNGRVIPEGWTVHEFPRASAISN